MLVATKRFSRQKFCRGKHTFVAKKDVFRRDTPCLSGHIIGGSCDKYNFLSRQTRVLSWQTHVPVRGLPRTRNACCTPFVVASSSRLAGESCVIFLTGGVLWVPCPYASIGLPRFYRLRRKNPLRYSYWMWNLKKELILVWCTWLPSIRVQSGFIHKLTMQRNPLRRAVYGTMRCRSGCLSLKATMLLSLPKLLTPKLGIRN